MTSAIDSSKPTAGTAFTADVRANFASAASEISTLQATVATLPQVLFSNLSLAVSIAGNALTIAVKSSGGANPSTTSPVRIAFRNSTVSSGDYTVASVTSALSLTISSGSTLGMNLAIPGRIWVVAFNDAGTIRLGAINCTSVDTDVKTIYPLGQFPVASSTAEGGVGGATSAFVFYTGVAVTSKPYAVLGHLSYETPLTTPGLYSALPSRLQLYGPGVHLPGTIVQLLWRQTGIVNTGTATIASSDTVPSDSSGTQINALSIDLTPTSACNVAGAEAVVNCASSSASSIVTLGLFDNLSTLAMTVAAKASPGVDKVFTHGLSFLGHLLNTAVLNVRIRIGSDVAATITLNGANGARLYGGIFYSYMKVYELMG